MRDGQIHAAHGVIAELLTEVFFGSERSGEHEQAARHFVETLDDAERSATANAITFGEHVAHECIEGAFAIRR
mgnify:CR=1 FL=1